MLVGQVVRRRALVEPQAPTGTVVRHVNTGLYLSSNGEDWVMFGQRTPVAPPVGEYEVLDAPRVVGVGASNVTDEELAALPVGSVYRNGIGAVRVKSSDGSWQTLPDSVDTVLVVGPSPDEEGFE